jgi:CBS domain-containing protein
MPGSEAFFNRAVKDYMRKKFYILKADDSVATAVRLLKDNNLGSVGVQFEDSSVGILTDRDIVLKVVAAGADPLKVSLGDIATRHPATVSLNSSLEEAMRLMRDNGILRLIVVDAQEKPVGLLVERWVFASFVSEVLGDRRAGAKRWLDRYIQDVTDAALMED